MRRERPTTERTRGSWSEVPAQVGHGTESLPGPLKDLCQDAALVEVQPGPGPGHRGCATLELPGTGGPLAGGGPVVRVATGRARGPRTWRSCSPTSRPPPRPASSSSSSSRSRTPENRPPATSGSDPDHSRRPVRSGPDRLTLEASMPSAPSRRPPLAVVWPCRPGPGGAWCRPGGPGADLPSRSELVVLSATAVDRKGRPVTDLERQECGLRGGQAPGHGPLHEGPDVPARVLLLVDASGKHERRAQDHQRPDGRQAGPGRARPRGRGRAGRLRQRVLGHRALDHATGAPIEAGFADLKPFGSTALHDALDHAAHDIASHGEGRRAVVVITDGVDTSSQETPKT